MKNKAAFERALGGHHQPALWRRLKAGQPIPITKLCRDIRPDLVNGPLRPQQQRVGAIVLLLNRLLDDYNTGRVILPGRPRGTYQLYHRS